MRNVAAILALAGGLIAAPTLADEPARPAAPPVAIQAQAIAAAVASPSRFFDRRRDAWRHPAETLAFFGVEPGMTVVDYIPAKGWYTRVLVPYLGAKGRYIGVHPDGGPKKIVALYRAKHEEFVAAVSGWTLAGAPIEASRSDAFGQGLAGQVDRVLIFRELHNLVAARVFDGELSAIRKTLKPDGMLGIVQHRAPDGAGRKYGDGGLGYLSESEVISRVEKAGFRLVAKSEINANPKDSADHAGGVWALPPVWRGRDAAKQAIGESDRMTLLFAKR